MEGGSLLRRQVRAAHVIVSQQRSASGNLFLFLEPPKGGSDTANQMSRRNPSLRRSKCNSIYGRCLTQSEPRFLQDFDTFGISGSCAGFKYATVVTALHELIGSKRWHPRVANEKRDATTHLSSSSSARTRS